MNKEIYEKPEIQVICIAPDKSLMADPYLDITGDYLDTSVYVRETSEGQLNE